MTLWSQNKASYLSKVSPLASSEGFGERSRVLVNTAEQMQDINVMVVEGAAVKSH